jgi:hypothetical protein
MSIPLTHLQNVFKKRENLNMSDDLVKRLRDKVEASRIYDDDEELLDEAADRIEKLETALREIEILEVDPRCSGQMWVETLKAVARKALEGKDG